MERPARSAVLCCAVLCDCCTADGQRRPSPGQRTARHSLLGIARGPEFYITQMNCDEVEGPWHLWLASRSKLGALSHLLCPDADAQVPRWTSAHVMETWLWGVSELQTWSGRADPWEVGCAI